MDDSGKALSWSQGEPGSDVFHPAVVPVILLRRFHFSLPLTVRIFQCGFPSLAAITEQLVHVDDARRLEVVVDSLFLWTF